MASVDVPVALLGYGTVGAAVNRLLVEGADEIERATGHRLRVTRALVRDTDKERDYPVGDGVLTTDFQSVLEDDSIALVAEVMGGVEPTGGYVLDLLRAGKPVVSANKQLLARRSADLFAAASEGGVQLRFEASVCAAIPVIKVLRESLVVTNVHRVLGIVNGTTNFILTRMEEGAEYEEALAEAQRLGYAEADPTDDVSGADAAAKMAVLATVAFGSRVELADVAYEGIEGIKPHHVAAARELDTVVRLVGSATLVDGAVDVRVGPAFVDGHHPLAAVVGAFNAVMLQGDAIREITLEGPGRRRDRDRLRGRRRHGQRARHHRHRLPPERRLLALARQVAAGGPALGVLRPPRGRRPPRRAGARRGLFRGAERVDRAAHAAPRQRHRRARPRHARGPAGRVEAALESAARLTEVRSPPEALRVITERGF